MEELSCCDECNGSGSCDFGPECNSPASECCGGCYRTVTCGKCNGTGRVIEYPFEEGDTYYTIEYGDIVESCWDEQSEELYRKDKMYFSTIDEALNYLNKLYNFIKQYGTNSD